MNISEFVEEFYDKALHRKYHETLELVKKALDQNISPEKLVTEGIAETLKRFQRFTDEGYERVSAFQLLAMGKIAEDSIEVIKPYLKQEQDEILKKVVVLGTIKSDFHALGKNILKLFLEMNKFKVIDLGLDVEPTKFVETAETEKADFIFISTMMLHNILGIKRVGDLLIQRNLKDQVKFFVGGAPFNYNYGLVEKVGADDSAENVSDLIEKLVGNNDQTAEESSKKLKRRLFRFFRRRK